MDQSSTSSPIQDFEDSNWDTIEITTLDYLECDVQTAQKELEAAMEKESEIIASINVGKNFIRALEAKRKVLASAEVPDEDLFVHCQNLDKDLNQARVNVLEMEFALALHGETFVSLRQDLDDATMRRDAYIASEGRAAEETPPSNMQAVHQLSIVVKVQFLTENHFSPLIEIII